MIYEWDENKAQANLAKHSVDFIDACSVFIDTRALVFADDRKNYSEKRYNMIGTDNAGDVLTVTFTVRGSAMRIISARRASRDERSRYHDQ